MKYNCKININKIISLGFNDKFYGYLNVFFDDYKNVFHFNTNNTFQKLFMINYKFLLNLIKNQEVFNNDIKQTISTVNKYSLEKIKFSYHFLFFFLTQVIFFIKNKKQVKSKIKKDLKEFQNEEKNIKTIKKDIEYSEIKIKSVYRKYGNKTLCFCCGIVISRCCYKL